MKIDDMNLEYLYIKLKLEQNNNLTKVFDYPFILKHYTLFTSDVALGDVESRQHYAVDHLGCYVRYAAKKD